MRSAWNTVSFLAVVHLLALAMFAGWLGYSQRLDRERLYAVRDLFALTTAEARMAREEAEKAAERQRLGEQALTPRATGDSAQGVRFATRVQEQADQMQERLAVEARMLSRQLAQREEDLARREAEFEGRQEVWERSRQAELERRTNEQFAQTVKQLESVPPKQGKRIIVELINTGKMDQAVTYLDAMAPRATTKVLREFKTDQETQLATELLERLRTFGLEAGSDPETSNADPRASAQ